MKAISFLFLFIFIFISTVCVSQTKAKKKVTHVKLEIDRLSEKYKDQRNTIIYFPGGTIEGEIYIDLNDDGKPKEISISGKSQDVNTVSKFLSYFIKQKISKGFKEDGEYLTNTAWDASSIESRLTGFGSVEFTLMKGKEYTIISCNDVRPLRSDMPGINEFHVYYQFVITTGDMRRIANKKSQTFDF